MTTLAQLIEQYCPNGVEYVKLGDVAIRQRGIAITAAKMRELDSPDGDIVVFGAGATKALIDSSEIPSANIHTKESVIVKARGHVGFEMCTAPFATKSEMWSYRSEDPRLNIKFGYYFLSEHSSELAEIARLNGVKLPQLKVSDTDDYLIPLPPREVQDAIVERLDAFAALIESLDSEIALREKRFEYFREQIFDEVLSDEQIPSKPLGELGVTYSGMTGKTKKDFGHGTGRYVPYTAVFSNREVHFDDLQAVDIKPGERQRAIEAGDVLFTGSSESLEEVGFTSVVTQEPTDPIYLNSFCFGFRFNAGVSMSPHFIKHLLMIHQMRKQVMKSANGVTRINISKKSLVKNVSLPLPSLEVQQDIADKLDTMQALIDNLKYERELRKSQFEYYREKLLTFNS